MSTYEPRDVAPPRSAEIPNDDPSLFSPLPTMLGFCVHRQEIVSEWSCRACFFGDADLREASRDGRGFSRRQTCVEKHIETPRKLSNRDATIARIAPMLDRLTTSGFRGIVANILESALAHPDEATSKSLIHQIEVHAMSPSSGSPDPT